MITYATALARMLAGYWNAQSKTDANPGGFGANGHTTNLPEVAEAIGVVAQEVATQAAAAGTATDAAATAVAASDTAVAAAGAAEQSATDAAAASGGVRVSADDTTPGPLEDKLTAGPGISLETTTPGGNEARQITATPAGNASAPVDMNGHKITVDAVEGDYEDLGDVTGAAIVNAIPYTRANMTGDTTFTLPAPAAGKLLSQRIKLVNDSGGAGARIPTFAGYAWIGAEPDWAAQPAGAETFCAFEHTPTGEKIIWAYKEPS